MSDAPHTWAQPSRLYYHGWTDYRESTCAVCGHKRIETSRSTHHDYRSGARNPRTWTVTTVDVPCHPPTSQPAGADPVTGPPAETPFRGEP